MKTKTSKRILSIFLTVLMLMSSFPMIFAHAEEAHTCVDTSPKDLYCDICHQGIKTKIDFSKANWNISASSGVTVTKDANSLTLSGKSGTGVKGYGFDTGLPVDRNIYDVEFCLEYSGSGSTRYTFWPVTVGSYAKGAGKLGWAYSKNVKQLCQVYDCGNSTYFNFNRDVEATTNKQYLKVRVDGINGVMTLYAKNSGEYTYINEYDFVPRADAHVGIAIGAWDAISTNYKISDAYYTRVCSDMDLNHKCDVCEQVLGSCQDENKDHKCDGCSNTLGTHVAISADNHQCAYCGDVVPTAEAVPVDFTSEPYTASDADMGGATVTYKVGEIGFSNKAEKATYAGVNLNNCPVAGNVYDVYYSLYVGDITKNRIGFQVVSTYDGTNGKSQRSGWVFAKNASGYLTKLNGGSTGAVVYCGTVDFDTTNGFEMPLKMRVDGINDILTLYVMKNGQYVAVDSYTGGIASSYLYATAYAWDAISDTGYAAVKNVRVERLCYDDDKDHACDNGCDKVFGTHADSETDNDHVCDYGCGHVFGECADGDGDHKCDTCGRRILSLCAEGETVDHKCETCGNYIGDLVDFTEYDAVSKASTDTIIQGGLGSLKVYDKTTGSGDMIGKDTGLPIKNHKYEITYTLNVSKTGSFGVSMWFFDGRYVNSNGKDAKDHIGWVHNYQYTGISRAAGYTIDSKDGTASGRVYSSIGDDKTSTRTYKVIIDGFNYTMSLWVEDGNGGWKEVEAVRHTFTLRKDDATLYPAFGTWTKTGDEYFEITDFTIYELCADDNKDHKCDICNAEGLGTHESTVEGDHGCAYCGEAGEACYNNDSNNDHKCDTCKAVVSTCEDNDNNHICDKEGCKKELADKHTDNDNNHVCDAEGCKKELADKHTDNDNNHLCDAEACAKEYKHTDADNDHLCDAEACSKKLSECIDKDKDHVCDYAKCDEKMGDHVKADGKCYCAYCSLNVDPCVDDNNNHLCDNCGGSVVKDNFETLDESVDFRGDATWNDENWGFESVERGDGYIKVSDKTHTGGGFYGTNTDYEVPGHIYEITYKLNVKDISQSRVRMQFVNGSFIGDGGKTVNAQTIGWVIYRTTEKNAYPPCGVARAAFNSIQYDSAKGNVGYIDNGTDYEQEFKVIVNGFDYTMTLFVKKDGEWVQLDKMEFTISATDTTLKIVTGSYDEISKGNYVQFSNVAIKQGCSVIGEDHKCTACDAVVGEHVSGHACMICGTLCQNLVDKNNDFVCDVCGRKAHKCESGAGSHKCSTCGKYVSVCADNDKDHKCDGCGIVLSVCFAFEGDHYCDYGCT